MILPQLQWCCNTSPLSTHFAWHHALPLDIKSVAVVVQVKITIKPKHSFLDCICGHVSTFRLSTDPPPPTQTACHSKREGKLNILCSVLGGLGIGCLGKFGGVGAGSLPLMRRLLSEVSPGGVTPLRPALHTSFMTVRY